MEHRGSGSHCGVVLLGSTDVAWGACSKEACSGSLDVGYTPHLGLPITIFVLGKKYGRPRGSTGEHGGAEREHEGAEREHRGARQQNRL